LSSSVASVIIGAILKEFDRHMQHEQAFTLPQPDALSAEQSTLCAAYIRERIRDSGGSISFAEFMHYVLYAPGLGYYSAGARKFGADGDFVTAPEISPLFGKVLARQCARVLASVDAGSVLEFGAGSGRLAVDVLRALARLDALPAAYRIIEVSADLRERQQQLLSDELPELFDRVVWLDRMPESHRGVVIANEVLDALPVERFLVKDGAVLQLRVTDELDEFVFVDEAAPGILVEAVKKIERGIGTTLPNNFVSEVSLSAPGWIADLAGSLESGFVFLFDYGVARAEYYAGDRAEGWLHCHFRHRAHSDPLILPGIQDLTAWVDFSAVATAAVEHGLVVAGYLSQAQFLLGGGLELEARDMSALPLESQLEMANHIKMLTLPGEMGENVKCMGLVCGDIPRPPAFELADRTHTL
jgi:SAM-dependent MidA family methyltransferase